MKVHLRMLGCRLNQAEIDQMARQLTAQGHEVVHTPEEADQFIALLETAMPEARWLSDEETLTYL
ncbi:MAG TPA: hypothetical protein PLZ51_28935, partial [Aggregatilineales bacterium]|nr:hypothetical protein [Aggregatilineales bacterium]